MTTQRIQLEIQAGSEHTDDLIRTAIRHYFKLSATQRFFIKLNESQSTRENVFLL